MGNIWSWPVAEWKKKHELEVFFETGTWRGAGVRFALDAGPWDSIHSCDVIEGYVDDARSKFIEHREVNIHLGFSTEVLERVIPHVRAQRVLWWLDAHLPDFYVGGEWKTHERYPLLDEIRFITRNKPVGHDVFVLDDWRLYERKEYAQGMWKEMAEGAQEILDTLGITHDLEISLRDEGYLVATPKSDSRSPS